jgi:DNA-binding SARP family transcriptional activator
VVGVSLVAAATRPNPRSAEPDHALRLRLLDAFELVCDGNCTHVPTSAQRVVAFVALKRHPVSRPFAAGSLWPASSEPRAGASLRSALWRLRCCEREIVEASGAQLRLGSAVHVDLHEAAERARRVIAGADEEIDAVDPSALDGELLPDWYEDWVLVEREHFRHLRLRALETLCDRRTEAGRLDEALSLGLSVVRSEPLRESAHRSLIRVHLAQGNVSEAMRQYRFCCRLLGRLGVEPSEQIKAMVRT